MSIRTTNPQSSFEQNRLILGEDASSKREVNLARLLSAFQLRSQLRQMEKEPLTKLSNLRGSLPAGGRLPVGLPVRAGEKISTDYFEKSEPRPQSCQLVLTREGFFVEHDFENLLASASIWETPKSNKLKIKSLIPFVRAGVTIDDFKRSLTELFEHRGSHPRYQEDLAAGKAMTDSRKGSAFGL